MEEKYLSRGRAAKAIGVHPLIEIITSFRWQDTRQRHEVAQEPAEVMC